MKAVRPIYVEIPVRASMDALWAKTQEPEQHERWDIRFSTIEYLPRPDESQPQRFLYETRIGFGLKIAGEGETVGTCERNGGMRTSALKFWSDDAKSLIETGSGYWKYIPENGGVKFLTLYDYKTRFGVIGRFFDGILFRPIMTWATAWSFDCLRLWIEEGKDPQALRRQALANLVARATVAFVWMYHGLVPKLIVQHRDEVLPLLNVGFGSDAWMAVYAAGILEMLISLATIVFWKSKIPLFITVLAMPTAILGIAFTAPELLGAAFNTVTTSTMLFMLAVVALITHDGLPSANHCNTTLPETVE